MDRRGQPVPRLQLRQRNLGVQRHPRRQPLSPRVSFSPSLSLSFNLPFSPSRLVNLIRKLSLEASQRTPRRLRRHRHFRRLVERFRRRWRMALPLRGRVRPRRRASRQQTATSES